MTHFFIETYGCQMNKAESIALAGRLTAAGYSQVFSQENAELIIINTCSVRKTAENRIWGRLGFYKKEKTKRDITVLVMGCMPQRISEELLDKKRGVDIVVGNFHKDKIPAILAAHRKGEKSCYIDVPEEQNPEAFFTQTAPDELNPAKAYLTISHGCNNFCSYCIVPYLRGREISRSSSSIIKEIHKLTELGVKQVMLLGQNVNSYGNDTKDITFAQLLKQIVHETDIAWVKFMSSHPKDLSQELIEVMADEPKISKWLHLALQSGSTSILQAMNRKYTREDFLNKIYKLREYIPDIILTTDLIIGFPGETEADYHDTLSLIEEVRFDDAFMYKYNERDNTLAQKTLGDPIEDEVKIERLTKLIEIQRNIGVENRQAMKGRHFQILHERPANDGTGRHIGISSNELIFLYDGKDDDAGEVIDIEATGVNGSTLTGKRL